MPDNNGVEQAAITGNGNRLAPLAVDSVSTPAGFKLQDSRYDLAVTSISRFRSDMLNYTADPANDVGAQRWWSQYLMASGGTRFQVNPFITKPITPQTLSQQSPLFLKGCTQFIVEYAGDYLKQNQDTTDTNPGGTDDAIGIYGDVQDTYKRYDASITQDPTTSQPLVPNISTQAWVNGATDGKTDFVVVNGKKQIRWYGMPRDVNGDGNIRMADGDVVPLRDSWELSQYNANPNQVQATRWAPFEKLPGSTAVPGSITKKLNYALPPGSSATTNGMANTHDYTCAWGPTDKLPTMIRITITIDDPGARTPDGQTFEYVYTLP